MISGGFAGGEQPCNCFSLDPTVEFGLGIIITLVGIKFPIIGLVTGLGLTAASSGGSICQADSSNLSQQSKDLINGLNAAMLFINVALAIIGLFVGPLGLVVSLAISMLLIVVSNMISNYLLDLEGA
jgi:hypothetical protein